MYAFLTSAIVALFIPSNRWLETVLLPFPIKKLDCLYLRGYASTSATFIVITLSISVQTGMLDFSGTTQKVQLVQHQEHVFSKPLYPIGGTMSCSLRRYMVCYYLATLFVLSLDSNTSGLHVNLLAGWTYIGGAGQDSMIGCSISVVSISPLPTLQTWISLV